MKIHLHLGVHKTATTYQQAVLEHNLPLLQKHGVGYLPLTEVRDWLTKPLMALEPAGFQVEQHLDKFFPAGRPPVCRGIIISDENLIGTCGGITNTGILYHLAGERIRHLKLLLQDHEVVVFIAVRSYADFLASAYCESLLGTRSFIEFTEFRKHLKMKTIHWPRLLDLIETELCPARIQVWQFEDYPSAAGKILSKMAFGIDEELVAVEADQRPSFSQAAIDFLSLAARELGQAAASKLINGVNAIAPRDAGYARFNPWPAEARSRLEARYSADCSTISASNWIASPSN